MNTENVKYRMLKNNSKPVSSGGAYMKTQTQRRFRNFLRGPKQQDGTNLLNGKPKLAQPLY